MNNKIYSKDALKEAYVRGRKDGKDIESFSDKELKTMENAFERWYKVNFDQ